jgi:hypothetical protein
MLHKPDASAFRLTRKSGGDKALGIPFSSSQWEARTAKRLGLEWTLPFAVVPEKRLMTDENKTKKFRPLFPSSAWQTNRWLSHQETS